MTKNNIKRNYRHFFHLVDQSPWPLIVAISALMITIGFVVWVHYGEILFMLIGLFFTLYGMFLWCRDVVRESTFQGYHTKAVRRSLKIGMILFIISEVFFFLSFFWAFFHSSLAPVIQIGSFWPPRGLRDVVFNAFDIPLLNTALLLGSGASITWAHYALSAQKRISAFFGFVVTIVLAILFTILQLREYSEAKFNFGSGIYGSVFFIATGFHGLHVLIGTIFIIVCFFRFLSFHFTKKHHEGFVFASWYWHFVDVVWIFLFFMVYLWGNW
jgi:cytochrome c oxidase subunit 3